MSSYPIETPGSYCLVRLGKGGADESTSVMWSVGFGSRLILIFLDVGHFRRER
jgi:hypothetical protein